MSGSTPVIDGFAHSNPGYTLAMCGLYMSLGVLAICANLLNIYIILTNRDLRAKYMFHLAVDFGELVNGVSYILTSIGRGSGVFRNTFTDLITIEQCFFTKYWPVFLIMGTELPSMFTIIISLERICAVHKPGKYNIYYSTNSKRCQIFLVIFLEGLSLGWAALSAKGNKTESTTQHCAIINSTDTVYSTFHFSFITIAYMACLISLVTTYWVHKKHTTTVGVQVGKSSNSMNLEFFIFVTSIQIILVAIPGVVMIGSKHNLWKPNDIVVGLTYSTTGFLSIVHTIINFILRKQFRNQFLHLIKQSDSIYHLNKGSIFLPFILLHNHLGGWLWYGTH
uniref:G_PROTEIN_RECEP_F1_2 domain-containing protein n=1 Tax=Rhabditophanes sp. KR3021 TaxID=114890 RepID=A0AC35TXS0_9BILA